MRNTKFFLVLQLALYCIVNFANAQGNLLITPRRVVFEGAKKIQELNLANIGKDTARYVISIVEFRMKEDGSFEKITEPDSGQRFASPYLRFFPRSVVLAPNEAQLVKIQLMKTNLLSDGEYRSHVYFRSMNEETPLGENEPRRDSGSISVSLIPIFGITTPVIIRVGESTTTINISDAVIKKENNIPGVAITFVRNGNMSTYGDVIIEHISPAGSVTQVGLAKGVAVYTPNPKRNFHLDLDKNAGVDYHHGKLRIEYMGQSDVKSKVLAEKEIMLH